MYNPEKRKEHYHKNIPQYQAYYQQRKAKGYYQSPEHKERRRKYAISKFEKSLFMTAKSRSKARGVEFTIEESDIHIPDICPYLQTPITRIHGKGIVLTNASLDRIDSTKGYIKGNVQIISKLANMMKSSATQEQLITFAKAVLK